MDRVLLTQDEALSVLEVTEDGYGHSMNQAGPCMVGADRPLSAIEDVIRSAFCVEISGDMARGMRHGLAASAPGGVTWFETNEDKLKALEDSIGNDEREKRYAEFQERVKKLKQQKTAD